MRQNALLYEILDVTRISLGASLARAAYGALMRAGKEVLSEGTFGYVDEAISGKEINAIFPQAIYNHAQAELRSQIFER